MDYKEKYELALKKAMKLYERGTITESLSYIFPELKESEDEKIRKALIRFHKSTIDIDGIKGEDIIAWLEKQGQEKHLSEPIKDYQGSFGCWNNAHDFRPKHLQRCICYDKYMKGVYCYVYDDISKYWCTQTTEEHDPDGDNHICDYADYRVTVWMPLPNTSFYPSKSWLEKQGEQKLNVNDNAKEMFIKALERVEEQNNKGYKLTDCDKNSWWEDFKTYASCTIEHNPADKVEPKFHEGDMIIHKELGGDYIHNPHKIIQVDILDKKYRLEGGLVAHFGEQDDYELVEQKPADIPEDFEKLVEHLLSLSDGEGHGSPAKVKEVSAELLRLANQQKSAWSEEDEQITLSIEQAMNCASLLNLVPEKMDKIRTWLKSLKQRIGG